jgi:hypothetical protein
MARIAEGGKELRAIMERIDQGERFFTTPDARSKLFEELLGTNSRLLAEQVEAQKLGETLLLDDANECLPPALKDLKVRGDLYQRE